MLKRTNMIVITKNKIITFVCLLLIAAFSVAGICIISKKPAVTAFSPYESILESEIVPSKKDLEREDKEKEKMPFSERIVKHFFGFGEKKKEEQEGEIKTSPSPTNEPLETEEIRSEVKTIDKGLKISNATSYNIDVKGLINQKLAFSIDNEGPQILIVHTHTTESYSPESYQKGAPDRDLDENKNVVKVGDAMRAVFEKNGISVIHDKTVHDYPSYNSAYQKTAATINKNLSQHKSIKVVLDVHRDGITRDDGTKLKLICDDGKTAQIMLVVGTDTNLTHTAWRENLKFAAKIQNTGIEMYPSLMRPIDVRQERFNQQLTYGSLIVEVGANGNTLEEAIKGGESIAEVVSKVLKEGK